MALLTPAYLASDDYSALEDRRTMLIASGGYQDGVYNVGDYRVSQRAAGANMSVDVAGGWAVVSANSAGNSGVYVVGNDSPVNVTVAASHASLPRIDQIILRVNDQIDAGDANSQPQLMALSGTPTSGATLNNRTGAAALPANTLRLADVLVPAASTTVVASNIYGRTPMSRGSEMEIIGPAQFNPARSTSPTELTGYRFNFESTGAPVEVWWEGVLWNTHAAGSISVGVTIDGVTVAAKNHNPSAAFAPIPMTIHGFHTGTSPGIRRVGVAFWQTDLAHQTTIGTGFRLGIRESVRGFHRPGIY